MSSVYPPTDPSPGGSLVPVGAEVGVGFNVPANVAPLLQYNQTTGLPTGYLLDPATLTPIALALSAPVINGAAGTNRGLTYETSLIQRWFAYEDATAESGGNVGSNWALGRYSDAGAYIENVMYAVRSTGAVSFPSAAGVTVTGTLAAANNFTALTSTIGTNTFNGILTLNGPASSYRELVFNTAGVNRWLTAADGTAETGSNAGSNFGINCYSDTGAYLNTPFQITRANSAITLSGPTTVANALTVTGGINNSAGALSSGAITTTGQLVSNYASAAPQLILNNTNPYQYMIEPQQSGTPRGYWGADANYCFRVADHTGSVAAFLLDNSGNGTLAGGVTATTGTFSGVVNVNNTLYVLGGISNTGAISTTSLSTNTITATTSSTGGVSFTGTGAAIPVLINVATGTAQQIKLEVNGANTGFWGATPTTSFNVVDATASFNTFSVDQTGNGTFRGNLTATALVGRTTAPTAGQIGELVESVFTGVSMTSGTLTNLTSISLTTGVWDVTAVGDINTSTLTAVSAGANGVSTTSVTLPAAGRYQQFQYGTPTGVGVIAPIVAPSQRLVLGATTTVYYVARATISSGTLTAEGTMTAVRVA